MVKIANEKSTKRGKLENEKEKLKHRKTERGGTKRTSKNLDIRHIRIVIISIHKSYMIYIYIQIPFNNFKMHKLSYIYTYCKYNTT